jgi:hypothetical protein
MRFILSFFAIALSINLCAQAPDLIPYQAVVRDAVGHPCRKLNAAPRTYFLLRNLYFPTPFAART